MVASPALAVDPAIPTTLAIISVKAARNLVETGDFFLACHVNIHYDSSQPTTPANELFLFRLMSTDGTTELGATVPYAYNNSGYDQAVAAFYFPAATAPTWGSAYIVRIDGNPAFWASPPYVTRTLGVGDYSSVTSQAANQSFIGSYLLAVAQLLEVDWAIKLVTTGDTGIVLNSTGETYFTGDIPGIKALCPGIFSDAIVVPTTTGTPAGTSLVESWQHQWDGTWVADALSSLGGFMGGIPWQMATGIFCLVVAVFMVGLTQVKFGNTDPGFLMGMVTFANAATMALIDWRIIGGAALLCGIYFWFSSVWRQG